ncbi:MAG: ketopantoate reductase family protein [Anaerolineae bacterium]
MRVLVVGSGAAGSWVGGHLAAGGADVTMVARGETETALRRDGLTLVEPGRTTRLMPAVEPSLAAALQSAEKAEEPFDVVLVAVKSYHTEDVGRELAAAASQGLIRHIVSVQNGVGNEETLADLAPDVPIHPWIVTTAIYTGPTGTITANGKGGVGLGPAHELATGPDGTAAAEEVRAELLELLRRGGLEAVEFDHGPALKWSKLLLNELGSATTAILGWTPERVFTDRRLFEIERAAWLEALAVMRAAGMQPVALPGYRVPLMALAASVLPTGPAHALLARPLAGGRGDRLPGTAADMAAGSARTEVEVLAGAVAAAGEKLGVATPVNRVLADLAAGIASGAIAREEYAGRPEALLAAVRQGGAAP